MARLNVEAWIPEEFDSRMMTKVRASSAIENFAQRVPMTTDTKNVPRSGSMDVGVVDKGTAYGEDASLADVVPLNARKFGKIIRIAEEDIEDTAGVFDIIEGKKVDWGSAYAKALDNAALGVTAVANGVSVPFTSINRLLSNADATTSYSANANKVTVATATAITYDNLSNVLGLYEGGDYFDEASTVVMAHPYFKGTLRGVKDTNGSPIFVETGAGTPDSLFGYPVRWTSGAKATAVATSNPGAATNPLLIVGNRDYLLLGIRRFGGSEGPDTVVIDGRDGASAVTDETLLKIRCRRGFGVGYPQAFAILDKTL